MAGSRTIPTIISDYARAGVPFPYIIDLAPSAADSWATRRYATNAVNVDGNDYVAAVKSVDRINASARIERAGTVTEMARTKISLNNESKLHSTFITDPITNRKCDIYMTAIAPNRMINSTFAKRTGSNFDDWTEVPGTGTITADTSVYHDNGVSVLMTTSGTEPYLISPNVAFRKGETVRISFWIRAANIGDSIDVAVLVASAWWNDATRTLGGSMVKNNFAVAAAATWERFDIYIAPDEYGSITSPFNCQLFIYASGNNVNLDAVQVENNAHAATPYHHNRYELIAADMLKVYTGAVNSWDYDWRRVNINVEPWHVQHHRIIPTGILESDTYSTWTIPPGFEGMPFPITYGEFVGDGDPAWMLNSGPALARGLLANVAGSATDGVVVYFDRPGMALYHPAGTYRLYHWHENNGAYYERMNYDDAGYSNDAIEWLDDLAANAKFKESANHLQIGNNKFAIMCRLRGRRIENPSNITNYENIREGDMDSYGYTTYTAGTAHFGCYLETFPFGTENIMLDTSIGGKDWCAFMLGRYFFTLDAVTGTATCTATVIAGGVGGGYSSGSKTIMGTVAPGTGWNNIGAPMNKLLTQLNCQSVTSGEILPQELKINVTIDITTTAGTGRFEIREMGALIYVLLPLEEANYAGQIYGRTFQDTWGGRKTATNMVQYPAEIIESLCRLELNAATADIETTLFDTARTDRLIDAAGQITELTKSRNIFKKICAEFGLLYYIGSNGTHCAQALKWKSSCAKLNMRDFHKPHKTIKVKFVSRDSMATDVRLYYDKNQFSGEYGQFAFCNRNGYSGSIGSSYQTKCTNAYAALGNNDKSIELECDWIKSTTSAETMVKWFIDWQSQHRIILEGEIFFDDLDLVLGDVVQLDLQELLPASAASSRWVLYETRLKRSVGRIAVKLLEIKEP